MRRVSVNVEDELFTKLAIIPWGARQRILVRVLEQVVKMIEEHGEIAIGAIMSDRLSLVEVFHHGSSRDLRHSILYLPPSKQSSNQRPERTDGFRKVAYQKRVERAEPKRSRCERKQQFHREPSSRHQSCTSRSFVGSSSRGKSATKYYTKIKQSCLRTLS